MVQKFENQCRNTNFIPENDFQFLYLGLMGPVNNFSVMSGKSGLPGF